jgi:hypothetical protein
VSGRRTVQRALHRAGVRLPVGSCDRDPVVATLGPYDHGAVVVHHPGIVIHELAPSTNAARAAENVATSPAASRRATRSDMSVEWDSKNSGAMRLLALGIELERASGPDLHDEPVGLLVLGLAGARAERTPLRPVNW